MTAWVRRHGRPWMLGLMANFVGLLVNRGDMRGYPRPCTTNRYMSTQHRPLYYSHGHILGHHWLASTSCQSSVGCSLVHRWAVGLTHGRWEPKESATEGRPQLLRRLRRHVKHLHRSDFAKDVSSIIYIYICKVIKNSPKIMGG